jgi:chorismate mutase
MSDAGHLDETPPSSNAAGSAVADDAQDSQDSIATGRTRIDEIDRAIIELIQRRIKVSREIQRARMSSGGRRIALSREMEVLGRYRDSLGKAGTSVAMTLLELCRGRAS